MRFSLLDEAALNLLDRLGPHLRNRNSWHDRSDVERFPLSTTELAQGLESVVPGIERLLSGLSDELRQVATHPSLADLGEPSSQRRLLANDLVPFDLLYGAA
jgi:hypothetical protein